MSLGNESSMIFYTNLLQVLKSAKEENKISP